MQRLLPILAILAVCIFMLPQFTTAATNTEKLNALSAEILEALQSFHPVKSTGMGVHAYDHRLTDYSSKSVKDMKKKLNKFEKSLHKFKRANLSTYDRNTYRLIKSNVDIMLQDLDKIKWHTRSPQLYVDEAVNGIYFLMLSEHAPLQEKLYSVLGRMKAVPGLLATARKNVKKPPQVYIDAAVQSLDSAIDFYQQVASRLMTEIPDRADEILAVSTRAREAMNDYLVYLQELQPGDEKGFSIGKVNFDYKLSNEYFLDFDSDSMLAIGETMLAEATGAYEEYEAYVEEQHQNGQDSVFVPASFCAADVMDYYNWEVGQVRLFLDQNDLMTIPEDIAPLEIVQTPPFLRTFISSIAYHPAGPFDAVQKGIFYVRPIPSDMDRSPLEAKFRYAQRRGFRGGLVHEGYPGHHLQMQLAARHEDPVRKWQMNMMMIEGWALYCEEMVYDAGMYGHEYPAQWLKILGGIKFRAARIVADVKLHTGQFTYNECVNWMTEAMGIDTESGKQFIAAEVLRYTHEPTIQMSYLMGKQEIVKMREAAEARDGNAFSPADFHDALLAEGSIPPALMWEILGLTKQ